MRCPRCQFENIPGRTRCFKCDSVLEAPAKPPNINPPRMSKWKKPLRNFLRLFREQKLVPDIDLGQKWKKHPETAQVVALFLDFIPGLGHLFNRCFREIWWLVLAWLILMASGIFFFPAALGFLFIGLALSIHIWILMKHSIIRNIKNLPERLGAAVVFLILLFALYNIVPRFILPNLTGAYTSLTIPYNDIRPRDFFLASRRVRPDSLQRGSFILIRPQGVRTVTTDTIVGQIIALPGEQIERNHDTFVVNGQVLDNHKYPVPKWLREFKISFTIGEDSYFVTSEFSISGQAARLRSDDILQACVYNIKEIRGDVFMRWTPVSKRGFIE
jgi:hypothetical protein